MILSGMLNTNMNTPLPPPGFNDLPKADQIRYLQNLWDQISQQPAELPVPENHLRLIEARLKRYRKNPSRGHSAFKVLDDLENKSK
jgi:Putative addiction module component